MFWITLSLRSWVYILALVVSHAYVSVKLRVLAYAQICFGIKLPNCQVSSLCPHINPSPYQHSNPSKGTSLHTQSTMPHQSGRRIWEGKIFFTTHSSAINILLSDHHECHGMRMSVMVPWYEWARCFKSRVCTIVFREGKETWREEVQNSQVCEVSFRSYHLVKLLWNHVTSWCYYQGSFCSCKWLSPGRRSRLPQQPGRLWQQQPQPADLPSL